MHEAVSENMITLFTHTQTNNLHCLWIYHSNSPALKQYNEECVDLISVEHKKRAIWAYNVESYFRAYHQKLRRSMKSCTLIIRWSLLYITYTWKVL